MEKEIIQTYVNHLVFIRLRSNRVYSGKLLRVTEQGLILDDKIVGSVGIDINEVTEISDDKRQK